MPLHLNVKKLWAAACWSACFSVGFCCFPPKDLAFHSAFDWKWYLHIVLSYSFPIQLSWGPVISWALISRRPGKTSSRLAQCYLVNQVPVHCWLPARVSCQLPEATCIPTSWPVSSGMPVAHVGSSGF